MNSNVDFYRRIDKIREVYPNTQVYNTVCQYQAACLPLLVDFYKEEAPRRGFEVACKYWSDGDVLEEELSNALCACLAYAKTIPHSAGDFSIEYWAIRALILCLYSRQPTESDWDAVEQMGFFVLYASWAHGWDERFESEAYRFFPKLRDV